MKKEKIKIKNFESFFLDDILNAVKLRKEISKKVKDKTVKPKEGGNKNGKDFNS